MGLKFDMVSLGLCPRPLQNLVETPGGRPRLLANLLDELRHVVDLFHANHVKFGVILSCNRECQGEGVKRMLRAVVGVQDLPEHCTLPRHSAFRVTGRSCVTSPRSSDACARPASGKRWCGR